MFLFFTLICKQLLSPLQSNEKEEINKALSQTSRAKNDLGSLNKRELDAEVNMDIDEELDSKLNMDSIVRPEMKLKGNSMCLAGIKADVESLKGLKANPETKSDSLQVSTKDFDLEKKVTELIDIIEKMITILKSSEYDEYERLNLEKRRIAAELDAYRKSIDLKL